MSKQRFLEAQGKEVPLDYFLYSCLEHERTQKELEAAGGGRIEWPALTGQQEGALTGEVAEKRLRDLLYSMANWYRDNHPALGDSKPLDYEQLLEVVGPLCAFNRDIDRLYRLRCEEDIPAFDASVGNNRIWDDVSECVNALFPAYAHLFIRYIQWSHAAEKEEAEDLSSRPPVGRYAPRFGRSSQGGASRQPSQGGRGKPRGDRPERGGDKNGRAREGRGERAEGSRRPRGEERNGGGRGRRSNEESAKLEEAALLDVYRAIKTLEKDPTLDEVTLKPTNSFYRRLQHQKAMESGYHSFSVGEGPDRAVKIGRKE